MSIKERIERLMFLTIILFFIGFFIVSPFYFAITVVWLILGAIIFGLLFVNV